MDCFHHWAIALTNIDDILKVDFYQTFVIKPVFYFNLIIYYRNAFAIELVLWLI